MTSLRFVGDVPLWIGITLSLIVAALSWNYYNREGYNLPVGLKLVLPLMRSLAFVMGILILTGPVLHHQTRIGELGKVKILIDVSASMTQNDPHMSLSRKLKIARQMGWLTEELPDTPNLEIVEQIAGAREQCIRLLTRMESDFKFDSIKEPLEKLLRLLESTASNSSDFFTSLDNDVIPPLKSIVNDGKTTATEIGRVLLNCQTNEEKWRRQIDLNLQLKIGQESQAFAAAQKLFDDSTRWQRIASALAKNPSRASEIDLLNQLSERHEVEIFLINQNEKPIRRVDFLAEGDPYRWLNPDDFGETTDLNAGIATSWQEPFGRSDNSPSRKQAVVLFSDGRHNSGESPIESSRSLASQGYSLFNVAIGSREPAVDLMVKNLEYPKLIFQKDEVRGQMIIRDSMTPGNPFVAQIRQADRVLWQKQLISQSIGERRINFQFEVDELVESQIPADTDVENHVQQLALTAAIVPLSGETETSNNQLAMRLNVITEAYQVLILDGRSRWETRFIRNAFERDEQWEVSTVIAGPTTDKTAMPRGDNRNEFPLTKNRLFEFDLIIWGEIDSDLLQPEEYKWLSEFVEIRGGGIIFIDGNRGKLESLEQTSISGMLPVLERLEALDKVTDSLELTPLGATQPALALATDQQENESFWNVLPAPKSLVAIEPTADSEILVHARLDDKKYPAIVSKLYGSGRVVYLAFDESWRWRYKSADTWHQRAWHQLAKFAMPRPFAESDEYLAIDTGPAIYEVSDSPSVRVKLKGLDGNPNSEAIVEAVVQREGKTVSTINLVADPELPGVYRSVLGNLLPGDYEVSIQASGYQQSALKSRGRFLVLAPELGESSETSVNQPLLQQMSNEAEGQLIPEEELYRLPELLEPLSNGRILESETVLWQSYWWFGSMMVLLTIEWILRKRSGLL